MFVIIVYDIRENRVVRVYKFLRRYLNWVQNSVFEGQLTDHQYAEIEVGLKKIIKKDEDSVRCYIHRTQNAVKIKNIGIEKEDNSTII